MSDNLVIVTGVVVAVLIAWTLLGPMPSRVRRLGHWSAHQWRRYYRPRLRHRRSLLLLYVGLATVAATVFVVWGLPSVLTRHPQLGTAADRHKAMTDTRTSLVAMVVAIGAAGGLAFTARTYRLSREGHITDRYSTAVEQLGNDRIEVRLGGIYALERLMRDSAADQPTIMETLAAFVRQHAPLTVPPTTQARDRRVAGHHRPGPATAQEHPPEDVQAVLTVLGRRRPLATEGPIQLSATQLRGAHLQMADLREVRLVGADLSGIQLGWAKLDDAWLQRADLTGADLSGSQLSEAQLSEANLTRATLYSANLTRAELQDANLTDARLDGANLESADLDEANLTRAHLKRANLRLVGLIGADLTDARLDEAQLAGARLDEAQLTGARLDGADLTNAWLDGADLTGARLDGADLTRARLDPDALSAQQRTAVATPPADQPPAV